MALYHTSRINSRRPPLPAVVVVGTYRICSVRRCIGTTLHCSPPWRDSQLHDGSQRLDATSTRRGSDEEPDRLGRGARVAVGRNVEAAAARAGRATRLARPRVERRSSSSRCQGGGTGAGGLHGGGDTSGERDARPHLSDLDEPRGHTYRHTSTNASGDAFEGGLPWRGGWGE